MLAPNIYGQGVAINTTGNGPDSSAMLDVASNNKGVLISRMTLAERNAIASPSNSLIVFVTDSAYRGYHYYDSLSINWIRIGDQLQRDSCSSLVPQPTFTISQMGASVSSSNTIVSVGQVYIPLQIKVQKITISTNNPPAIPGKVKIGLYSENGQSKIFEVTTDSIFINGPVTTQLNIPITITPGNYYIMLLPIGNTSLPLIYYLSTASGYYLFNPPSGNILQGYLNVIPDTLPTNFDPTSIMYQEARCLGFRIN